MSNNNSASQFRWKIWGPVIVGIVLVGAVIAWASTRSGPVYDNPDSARPFLGKADSAVVLTEFSDFQCPACGAVQPVVKQVVEKYGDRIRFEYKHYPLTRIHVNAYRAALASECANDQGKFWDMHDKMFANQNALGVGELKTYAKDLGMDTAKFDACLDSRAEKKIVDADISEGNTKKVGGTPSFFLNGQYLQLAAFTDLEKAVQAALGGVQQGPVK